MREIEWRIRTRDLTLRTEQSSRVDEANARALELQEMLSKQKIAYDMLQAARSNIEGEMVQQEEEIAALALKLQQVSSSKRPTPAFSRLSYTNLLNTLSETPACPPPTPPSSPTSNPPPPSRISRPTCNHS